MCIPHWCVCVCEHKLHIYQIGVASFSVVSKCKKQPQSTHSPSQRRGAFGVVTKPMFLFPRNVHVCWHDKASVCVRFSDANVDIVLMYGAREMRRDFE